MNKLGFTFLLLVSATQSQKLPEILTREGATTLVDLVVKAGLEETLMGDGPFTVFAPTNEAFDNLPQDTLDALSADVELLKRVLLYHVLPTEVKADQITEDNIVVESAEGTKLRINTYMKKYFYEGFVTVNGKRVSRTDVTADNGVIHFITDVIDVFAKDDCVKVLTDDGKFGNFLKAIEAAELTSTISETDPITIFAPADEAFEGIEDLEALLADKEAVAAIVKRHLVPQAKFSRGLVWEFLDTLGGEQIATHVFKAGYTKVVSNVDNMLKKAKLVDADHICSNGVIHVIDTVL